jgi:hypothetical protein
MLDGKWSATGVAIHGHKNATGHIGEAKVRERKSNSGPPFAKSTLAETRRLESLTFANVGFRLNFVP